MDWQTERHIKSLDLKTEEEYFEWCSQNGFALKIRKTLKQRNSEKQRHRDQKYTKKLKKLHIKQDIVDLIPVKNPSLMLIDYFKFLKKKTRLLKGDKDLIKGVHTLWLYRHRHIRDYKDFKPRSKNAYKQFSQLVRYLLTNYKIPLFMDQAWFIYSSDEQAKTVPTDKKEIQWFCDIAEGKNIRKSKNIPCALTKRQAHLFLEAPNNYSIWEAFRYGQIMGMGGTPTLVHQVISKLRGTMSTFWEPLVWLYINNPMLDIHTFSEIVDYVHAQRTGHNAPNPGFSFKGRTAETLFRQSEEWHVQVRKTQGKNFIKWDPQDEIVPLHKEEGIPGKNNFKLWTINELIDSKALSTEGQRMKHCVRSYVTSCKAGRCSIWSLQRESQIQGIEHRVTIEVSPHQKSIVQMKGHANRKPTTQEVDVVRDWAVRNGLSYGRYC